MPTGIGLGLPLSRSELLSRSGFPLIGIATETDSALPFTISKKKLITLASETDTALPLTVSRRKTIGIASETDSAFALTVGSSFSPLSLPGLVLWLDASNLASFTFGTGSLVSDWADLSPSGLHLSQSNAAKQPIRNGVLNSLGTVVFSALTGLKSTANLDLSAVNKVTTFGILRPSALSSVMVFCEHTVSVDVTAGSIALVHESASKLLAMHHTANGTNQFYNNNTLSTSVAKAFLSFHDTTLAGSEASSRVAGATSGSYGVNQDSPNNLFANATHSVGARNDASAYNYLGEIAEYGICTGIMSSTNYGLLEAYYASKWGV